MNTTKKNISTQKELEELLQSDIPNNLGSLNLLCAGHFLLIPDANKQNLIPAIFSENENDPYYKFAKQMVGVFPQFTFNLAAKAIQANKNYQSKSLISLLVNDWQLVPEDKRRTSLSEPNLYRKSFFENFTSLPEEYTRILKENNLSLDEHIYKTNTGEFYLKEINLRDRFMRMAKSLFRNSESNFIPVGMCSLELDDCGNINMRTEDEILQKLSDKSKPGCAAGVAQMIIDIFNQHKDSFTNINFINFMPWGCINPVNAASELALGFIDETSKQTQVTIANYYFDGSNTNKPEDFYNKENGSCIVNYTFKNY